MSNALIRIGMERKLNTWAAAQSPAITVARQNQTFTPTAARYVRVAILPAPAASETLDKLHRRYAGIFQVTLCMPTGAGAKDAEALVDSLVTAFTPATSFTELSLRIYITEPASPAPGIPTPERYEVPVSISYVAHAI